MVGHVYILVNAAMAGSLKIGMTTKTPEERAEELSSTTGVPVPFVVAYAEEVADCFVAEQLIHQRLAAFRLNKGREFFNIPLREAIRVVSGIARDIGKPPAVAADGSPLAWCENCKKLVSVKLIEHNVWNAVAVTWAIATFFIPYSLPVPGRDPSRTCADCGVKIKNDAPTTADQ